MFNEVPINGPYVKDELSNELNKYHIYIGFHLHRFKNNQQDRTAKFFRLINEIKSPKIGRALLFRLVNDTNLLNNNVEGLNIAELLSDNMYECNKELKKSFLTELLKWDVNNITDNLNVFNYDNNSLNFRFIHTNYNNV